MYNNYKEITLGAEAMVQRCFGMALAGIDAFPVIIEADITTGLPAFDIVGLPDAAVKESRDRVRSAMRNCGYDYPVGRITINLAPADIKKEGPLYDLPILVALLKRTGQLCADIDDAVFIGEISLSGTVRAVNGILPMTIDAMNAGYKRIFIPSDNAREAAVVQGIEVYPVDNIKTLCSHLSGRSRIPQAIPDNTPDESISGYNIDFSQVMGQYDAKRAIEIAAAGSHNILLIGPPGSGKSMLAQRVPTILPDMTFEETIETTKIYSIAGLLPEGSPLITKRPFRSPHHSASPMGITGGGRTPKPGEISLANNGVLFLDELPEFSKFTMEALRQPLEDGKVTISRVSGTLTYPCNISLICAMNPCPCGYYGDPTKHCTCTPNAVKKYLNKISGPLLDRIDLHVEVPAAKYDDLSSTIPAESSAEIRKRVNAAREIQTQRYKGTGISCNARINAELLHKVCVLDKKADSALKRSFEKLGLSSRAYTKVLKVARTIADLEGEEIIKFEHISEALQFRSLDRKYWNR